MASAEGVWLEQADHLPETFDPVSKHIALDFNVRRRLPDQWVNNWFSGWNRTARIDWPERGLAVQVDASEDLNHYVVFSPSPTAGFFCFEPVSHPVDAFHLPGGPQAHGMKVLDPSGSLAIATQFSPERKSQREV
jgi:aldose 1-epimerase